MFNPNECCFQVMFGQSKKALIKDSSFNRGQYRQDLTSCTEKQSIAKQKKSLSIKRRSNGSNGKASSIHSFDQDQKKSTNYDLQNANKTESTYQSYFSGTDPFKSMNKQERPVLIKQISETKALSLQNKKIERVDPSPLKNCNRIVAQPSNNYNSVSTNKINSCNIFIPFDCKAAQKNMVNVKKKGSLDNPVNKKKHSNPNSNIEVQKYQREESNKHKNKQKSDEWINNLFDQRSRTVMSFNDTITESFLNESIIDQKPITFNGKIQKLI